MNNLKLKDIDISQIDKAYENIYGVRDEIKNFVVKIIEEKNHNIKIRDDIDILLGEWLDSILHIAYAKWIEFDEKKTFEKINRIDPSFDVKNYKDTRLNVDFHLTLVQLLYCLKHDKLENLIINSKSEYSKIKKNNISLFDFSNFISKKKFIIFSLPFRGNFTDLFFFYLKNLRNIFFVKDQFLSDLREISIDFRKKNLLKIDKKFNFKNYVKILIILFIPVSLLENLDENLMLVEKYIKKFKLSPKAIFSTYDLNNNLFFKILYILLKNKTQTKLFYFQHGGKYGIDKDHLFEKYETKNCDFFVSWGWKNNSIKDLKFTLPFFLKSKKNKKKRILLTTINYPEKIILFNYQPTGKYRIDKMKNDTCFFIKKLNENIRLNLRLYKDYDDKFSEKVNDLNKKNVLDKIKDPVKSYSVSSLVIHNYLGTSWLESIYLNVPTVCFFDSQVYAFRDDFKIFKTKLIENNIWFTDPLEAAKFINKINDNPMIWWQTDKIQILRKEIIKKYFNFSDDPSVLKDIFSLFH